MSGLAESSGGAARTRARALGHDVGMRGGKNGRRFGQHGVGVVDKSFHGGSRSKVDAFRGFNGRLASARWVLGWRRCRFGSVADRAGGPGLRARTRVDSIESAVERALAGTHWRARATMFALPSLASRRCKGSSTSNSAFCPTLALPCFVNGSGSSFTSMTRSGPNTGLDEPPTIDFSPAPSPAARP